MRLELLSDLHARFLPPENRVEQNFFEDVVMFKLEQALKLAHTYEVDAIIQAGDFFDTWDVSRYVMSRMIQLFRKYGIPIYTVLGQHDLAYRNMDGVNRTATYLLQSAGVLEIVGLGQKAVHLAPTGKMVDEAGSPEDQAVFLSGISFEQPYNPEPVPGAFNILVAHASVGDTPLYPGHQPTAVRSYVKQHKGFDLMVLGDIHYEYADNFMGCQVFNTGPLIRKSVEEKEQKPNVVIYNTKTRKHTKVCLEFNPWQTAFAVVQKSVESNQRLQEFLDLIKNDKQLAVSFDDNLDKYYQTHDVKGVVKAHIAFALEKAKMSGKELREVEHEH